LQLVIEKITRAPYYIVAIVDHHVSLFLSCSFSLLLVPKVEDQDIEIHGANFELWGENALKVSHFCSKNVMYNKYYST
jgi:hypothetical protein